MLLGVWWASVLALIFLLSPSALGQPSPPPSKQQDQVRERRVALVIGISNYSNHEPLPNTINDARDLAAMLSGLGFEGAEPKLNLDREGMISALREFEDLAETADIAVLHFAGHGMEIDGENFLIPSDADLSNERDVADQAVSLTRLLRAVEGAGKIRIIILDACRNNPFERTMKRKRTVRTIAKGLAPIEVEGDVLVVYSAQHGTEAEDGEAGQNSPFAEALLEHMPTPGLDVTRMLGRVRDSVLQATEGRQRPFTYGSLGGEELPLARWMPESTTRPRPVLPFSSDREISDDDLSGLTCGDLYIARNEIYHRKGFCFSSPRAMANFNNSNCNTTNQGILSELEKSNADRMKLREYKLSCPK